MERNTRHNSTSALGRLSTSENKQRAKNLDAIISVGYRVNSVNATAFRRWATNVLRDYLLKGYSVNHQLVALQQHVDDRLIRIEDRLQQHEEQISFFVRTNQPPIEGIFYPSISSGQAHNNKRNGIYIYTSSIQQSILRWSHGELTA